MLAAVVQRLSECHFLIIKCSWPTTKHASGSCGFQSSIGTLFNNLPLKLGQGTKYMEHQLTTGCCGVYILLQAFKPYLSCVEIVNKFNELLKRASQPIYRQTTKVSPALRWLSASSSPLRSVFAPLIVSLYICVTSQPALTRASSWRSRSVSYTHLR